MSLLLNFAIGFIASFVGAIPPGLLNMSAVKISINEGRKKGLLFSIGVCVTVMIQTYIALLCARYLDRHPEVVDMLQKVALGIFICISIYFFFIAKDTRREMPEEINKSKTRRFLSGMFLGALNLLPLPYWVYVSITFAGFGWFKFTPLELFAAVFASGLGIMTMMIIYVQFFRKKEDQGRLKVNMNYIIGFITTVISVITAVKIFNKF
jgi:threonine/homoserine/homoserine lactone efflux protein